MRSPSPALRRVRAQIHAGGVGAYPTEGVWGLGCDPLDSDAIARLIRLKGRGADKGLIVIAAGIDQIQGLVQWPASDSRRAAILATWPGPGHLGHAGRRGPPRPADRGAPDHCSADHAPPPGHQPVSCRRLGAGVHQRQSQRQTRLPARLAGAALLWPAARLVCARAAGRPARPLGNPRRRQRPGATSRRLAPDVGHLDAAAVDGLYTGGTELGVAIIALRPDRRQRLLDRGVTVTATQPVAQIMAITGEQAGK